MWKEIGAAVGGDIAGALVGGAFNAREAHKNRSFQRSMSNTAYQRAADDLEAAGLNRILALGSPASTPSGDSASINAPRLGETGIMAASAKQAIQQQKAQTGVLEEQKRLIGAEADKAVVMKKFFDVIEPLVNELGDGLQKWLQSGARGDVPQVLEKLIEGTKSSARSAASSAGESIQRSATSVRDSASMAIGDFVDSIIHWIDDRVTDPNRRQRPWREWINNKEKSK